MRYFLILTLAVTLAQGEEKREVLIDEEGKVAVPGDFWEANTEAIKGALSTGEAIEWLPMAGRITPGLVTITSESEEINPYDPEKAVSAGALLRWWDVQQMVPIRPYQGSTSNPAYGFRYYMGETAQTGLYSPSPTSISATIDGIDKLTLTESEVQVQGGATVMGALYADGPILLGMDQSVSTTINSGTLSAPNATATAADRIANVGALDERYKWLLRPEDISISNFSGAVSGTSGGSVEIRPGYARLRTPTGSGNAWMKVPLWGGSAPGQTGATSFPFNRNFKVTIKWTQSGNSQGLLVIVLPVSGQWEGQQTARSTAPYTAVGWMIGGGHILPMIQKGIGPITSIIRSANVATVTTSLPHGLTTGTYVGIQGQTPTSFEGGTNVTKINDYTFTYPSPGPNATATQNGYIEIFDIAGMGRPIPGYSSTTNSYEGASLSQATMEFKAGTVYWSFNGVAFGSLAGMPTTPGADQYLGITSIATSTLGPSNFDLLNITLQAR